MAGLQVGSLPLGPLLLVLGSFWLVAVYIAVLRIQSAMFTVTMAMGAVSLLAGNSLWLAGYDVYRIVLFWAGFLILTIAGERLELSRMLRLPGRSRALFTLVVAALGAALLLSTFILDWGARLFGVGLIGLALWLLRNDIARRTIRQKGLTRFMAMSLLLGYAWLIVGGVVAIVFGLVDDTPYYDALLHCIFLGFVFSMIFAHAPVIPTRRDRAGRALQADVLRAPRVAACVLDIAGRERPDWLGRRAAVGRYAQRVRSAPLHGQHRARRPGEPCGRIRPDGSPGGYRSRDGNEIAGYMESKQTWGGESRQNHLYKPFLRGALITVLTVGCTLGAINLAVMAFKADLSAAWGSLIQSHAYAQIFGWVGLFIMGMAYHMVPRFFLRPLKRPGLVAPSLLLVASGLVLRFLSQPLAHYPLRLVGDGAVSAAWPVRSDPICVGHVRYDAARQRQVRPARLCPVYRGGLRVVLAGFGRNRWDDVIPRLNRLDTIPPSWDAPYLRGTLNGAIVTMILGFTLRTVPQIMGTRPPSLWHPEGTRRAVFAAYTLAVLLQVAGESSALGLVPAGAEGGLGLTGAALEVAALVSFVALLKLYKLESIFAHRHRKNAWPERFVRTAYFWLYSPRRSTSRTRSAVSWVAALCRTLSLPAITTRSQSVSSR